MTNNLLFDLIFGESTHLEQSILTFYHWLFKVDETVCT